MGTHCYFFSELEHRDDRGQNKHLGVYCHYDGYPKHMLPALANRTCDEVQLLVILGGSQGGFRFLNAVVDEGALASEPLDHTDAEYSTSPFADKYGDHSYVYIKHLDGSVTYRVPSESPNLSEWPRWSMPTEGRK